MSMPLMREGYTVREVGSLPDCSVVNSARVCYPPSDIFVLVSSELAVWQVEETVGGVFSWSFWRSFFKQKPDYVIVLRQTDCQLGQSDRIFVLHATNELETAQEAFAKIQDALEPLVDDCTLLLTKGILETLVLPFPKQASELAYVLMELMEKKPDAHPNWAEVMKALMLVAVGQEIDEGGELLAPLKAAFEKNSLVQQGAGLTTVTADENESHLAAEQVDARVHKKDSSEQQQLNDLLNAVNKEGRTPLMTAVCKEHVFSSSSLLQAGAEPNIRNPSNGYTALHYAAELGNLTLVKLLVVFSADIKAVNSDGKTALDIASSAECVQVLQETAELMDKAVSDLLDEPDPIHPPEDAVFLLCMDGGGSRTLLTGLTLIALRDRMKELCPTCLPIQSCFDYIAGTSGGGIVALGLSHIAATPEMCRDLTFKVADESFIGRPTFPTESVEKCMQEIFGADRKMLDSTKPVSMVITALADRNPPKLHVMCNYGESRDGQVPPSERKVWEAARATTAAPVYFKPFEGKIVDGGVMAGNPTLSALTEIFNRAKQSGKPPPKLGLVVSIGTGVYPPTEVEDVAAFVPHLGEGPKVLRNMLSGFTNLLQLFVNQCTLADGEEVKTAEAWCSSAGAEFIRLTPLLSKVVDLSTRDRIVLTNMMYQGHLYLLREAKTINRIAKYLLARQHITS